jgi:hypothetical protein
MPQIVGYGIPVDTHTFTKRDLVDVRRTVLRQKYLNDISL